MNLLERILLDKRVASFNSKIQTPFDNIAPKKNIKVSQKIQTETPT